MNAYRLAICEDNDTIRAQLHSLCREVLNEIGVEHSIMDFSSAQELENLLEAENNPFDLLLLDIQMEGLTGMELAPVLTPARRPGKHHLCHRLRGLSAPGIQCAADPLPVKAGQPRSAVCCAAYRLGTQSQAQNCRTADRQQNGQPDAVGDTIH